MGESTKNDRLSDWDQHGAEFIEDACKVMHDAYEQAAVAAGWETQQRSRVPWDDVPEANKQTMRAAVTALLNWIFSGRHVQGV